LVIANTNQNSAIVRRSRWIGYTLLLAAFSLSQIMRASHRRAAANGRGMDLSV
jgi:hypothetical protein